jgi:sortase A
MRRHLRILSTVLIAAGALLLTDAAVTVLWQEPFSASYAHFEQKSLQDRLAQLERTPLAAVDQRALSRPDVRRRLRGAARALARRSHLGDPLGRIRMPTIGVDTVFVDGTGSADLRKGPGHFPATPLPGVHGTVGIAGHRSSYGAPFRDLDRLHRGDRIELAMPYGRFTYQVERTRILPPTAVWVTDRVGYDRLILSACHPLYSAAQRMVVFARLERGVPRGPAAAP